MIDAELRYPYLLRNHLNRVIGFNEKSRETDFNLEEYYAEKTKKTKTNEEKISENVLDIDKDETLNLKKNKNLDRKFFNEIKNFETQRSIKEKEQIDSYFEIDYEVFQNKFWNPIILKKHTYKSVSCNLAWTQIYSVIKGSKSSALMGYEYENIEKNLSAHQKNIIFKIFQEYEFFKRSKGGYDMMDLVGHILRQIEYVLLSMKNHLYFL